MKLDIGHHLERSFALFTPTLVIAELLLIYCFLTAPTLMGFLLIIFVPLLVPVLTNRLVTFFAPMREGVRYAGSKGFDAWIVSYRLQGFYYLFPIFERFLLAIPGAYSMWLRAWGSKIGRKVVWSPNVEVIDRGMIEVGDKVLFGYQAALSSHIILFENRQLKLILSKVRLAPGTLVGGRASLGPGCKSNPGETLKAMQVYADYSLLGVECENK